VASREPYPGTQEVCARMAQKINVIDKPGECFIVNIEPEPGIFEAWKVVKHEKFVLFHTINDTVHGSWMQHFGTGTYETADEAISVLKGALGI